MKILVTLTIVLLVSTLKLMAAPVDADSLKQQISVTSDSLKGPLYSQIADTYLHFDTIETKKKKLTYQNNAINYTLLALHYYSKYDDTIGLRSCFDNLAKVYYAQKKYSQAKWFILQSNSLSRAKNDVPNIISSLLILASVKTDIKDYSLAMRDLNESLQLSIANHSAQAQSAVEQSYAMLYMHMKKYSLAAAALKRHNAIDDSIRHSEEAALVAKLKAEQALENKKKFYTLNNDKVYQNLYFKRIVSL